MERTDQPTRQPSPASIREPLWGPAALQLRDQLRALLAADPAAEPWPAGVTARYLTVAHSTVDVHTNGRSYTCRGCGEGITDLGERRIRELAQGHAEKCRALPRPAVTA